MTHIPRAFPDRIDTPRLQLRPPEVADAPAMFSAYTQDAEVARYMVWRPHASLAATRDFLSGCVRQWQAGVALPYILTAKADGALIGMLELRPDGHTVNIGYVLARSHWGQGLMVEAIRAVTAHALALPTVFRIEATCDVENGPSARALEKSGFSREGRLARHTVHPNLSDEPRDCFIYAACRA